MYLFDTIPQKTTFCSRPQKSLLTCAETKKNTHRKQNKTKQSKNKTKQDLHANRQALEGQLVPVECGSQSGEVDGFASVFH